MLIILLVLKMESYEVMDENGQEMGVDILLRYFGNLWESAMDRLAHQCDGHLFTLNDDGRNVKIYRKLAQ